MPDEGPQRLQKVMARAGVASRRHSEELITAGRVRVNGEVVTSLGVKVDPQADVIEVDDRVLETSVAHAYFALNKPRGYVTTMSDPQGRRTIVSFLPKEPAGLFAVGRLDMETEGLLLITNDGDLADRLMHPRHHVPKTYRAVVAGRPRERELQQLRDGVRLDDGMTAPADVAFVEAQGKTSLVRITIREGRKRQLRRMFSAVGHPVVALKRVSFGPIVLGDQPQGTLRALSAEEVEELKAEAFG
jgi:23S rRNA pseudouridine2605 synthase